MITSRGLLIWPNGRQVGYLDSLGGYGHYYDKDLGLPFQSVYTTPEQAENHNRLLLEQHLAELDSVRVGGKYNLYLRSVGYYQDTLEVSIRASIPLVVCGDRDVVSKKVEVVTDVRRGWFGVSTIFIVTFVRGNKRFRIMIKPPQINGMACFERIS